MTYIVIAFFGLMLISTTKLSRSEGSARGSDSQVEIELFKTTGSNVAGDELNHGVYQEMGDTTSDFRSTLELEPWMTNLDEWKQKNN